MIDIKKYVAGLQDNACVVVALLDALVVLEQNDQLHVVSGKQVWILDFSEQIEILRATLKFLKIDPVKASRDRADGLWF